jgi:uncharacterized membrane protein
MSETYIQIVSYCSLAVGSVGLFIILIGALRATFMYLGSLTKASDRQFSETRLVLGGHIVLGLDFLVAQDIMNTILLDRNEHFWQGLAELVTVVIVRVVLTHFMIKEMNELEKAKT